ncbi:soluble NSF attachment family protein [Pandoraea sputorum]|uniref:Uncharacterized protein n=1 Tax=Pandoraea sputorum TaxID=93222 RepID=A0A5E5BLE2_9BURK|nr:hypothetical protein [Pandoraea sputorum]VVE85942.1 hypothetical protein PSP31121_05575 [Pandoraea sputorum]
MIDGATRLARRYAHQGPLVSANRYADLQAILDTVDFPCPQTVTDALRAITHMGWLDRLLDNWIYNGQKAASLQAFALLILYQRADFIGHVAPLPQSSRDDAIAMLAPHLTARAQTDLLRTLDENAGHNEFSRFLSDRDRWCLARLVCLAQGDEYAAQGTAHHAHAAQGRTLGQTHQAHAAAARGTVAAAHAVAAYTQAITTHQRILTLVATAAGGDAQRHRWVADAYTKLGTVYASEALCAAGGGALQKAGEAFEKAGEAFEAAGADEVAENAYEAAENVYRKAGLPDRAAAAKARARALAQAACETLSADLASVKLHWMAGDHLQDTGDVHTQARLYALAARAYVQAAIAYANARCHDLFRRACEKAGDAHRSAGSHVRAGRAFTTAAISCAKAGLHWQAARLYTKAAEAYTQAQLPALAGDAYLAAASACVDAGELELAADYQAKAAEAHRKAASDAGRVGLE